MRTIRVFICDDSKELCAVLSQAISKRSDMMVAGVANDGETALAELATIRPDVLLLDLIMPKMDGIGVLERLQSDGTGWRPKIIVFSAVGAENLAHEVLTLGADYYIIKPFQIDMLCTRIWQVVNEPGSMCERPDVRYDPSTVTDLLLDLGVPRHLKGFACLKEAILLVLEEEGLLSSVTKRLYPAVGERCGVPAPLVERNLRHLVEHTWAYGNLDRLHEVFGTAVKASKGKPTNSSFIAKLADVVRISQRAALG